MGQDNSVGAELEWYWDILERADTGGFKTGLKCPECGGLIHTVVQLGRVGINDQFGVACAGCGERVARMSVDNLHPEAKIPSETLADE